ncbi:MAG: 2-hydroxychromene-2-carboxylate isomerase [Novosphingobium sp.]
MIEFFYDLSSPWTYLAFRNIEGIAGETGAGIRWRPVLAGGVFNAVNKTIYVAREDAENPKVRHGIKILHDWARLSGLAMTFPSPHHPLKSVAPMRMCCVLEEDQAALSVFSGAAFDAYFRLGLNLDDTAVLVAIATQCGHDGEKLLHRSAEEQAKARLRANTQELIDRGGYGSPTIFIGGTDMYFGNDQLPLVRRALERGVPT